MSRSLLDQRAILAVCGDDAETLLNRLFTNTMLAMAPGASRYAALLSPQGKILFDFIVYRRPDGFWLDCAANQSADLAKKLVMFRLRSRVTIAVDDDLRVAAVWGDDTMLTGGDTGASAVFRDPRHDQLGWRIVGPPGDLPTAASDSASYEAHCISLGIPTGGVDFPYGDTFVHDANFDVLHGIDFGKGCYVGQEVVSRVHHRKAVRKRVVQLRFHGDAPSVGAMVTAGPLQIGTVTSVAGLEGLAMARIDRLDEAGVNHVPILAGETLVAVTLPSTHEGLASLPADHVA